MNRSTSVLRVVAAFAVTASSCFPAHAQMPAPAPAPASAPAAAPGALDPLAWLRGCWAGSVNRRNFIEQWLPPRADMMVGVSHTIVENRKNANEWRTLDYTYLRLEARADGVYYIAIPSGKSELSFKLTGIEDDKGTKVVTFAGSGAQFPQRIVYHLSEGGSLFAEVAGRVDGKDEQVIYPMQHVDCITGARTHE